MNLYLYIFKVKETVLAFLKIKYTFEGYAESDLCSFLAIICIKILALF